MDPSRVPGFPLDPGSGCSLMSCFVRLVDPGWVVFSLHPVLFSDPGRFKQGVCSAFLVGRARVMRVLPSCFVRVKRLQYAGISRGFVTVSNALISEPSRFSRGVFNYYSGNN